MRVRTLAVSSSASGSRVSWPSRVVAATLPVSSATSVSRSPQTMLSSMTSACGGAATMAAMMPAASSSAEGMPAPMR